MKSRQAGKIYDNGSDRGERGFLPGPSHRRHGAVKHLAIAACLGLVALTLAPGVRGRVEAALEPADRPAPVEAPAPARVVPQFVERPKFLRIVIDRDGGAGFEGRGTPGAEVVVEASGLYFGPVTIAPEGRWRLQIARALGPGRHLIRAEAQGSDLGEPVGSRNIYISVPKNFQGPRYIAFGPRATQDVLAVRRRRLAGLGRSDRDHTALGPPATQATGSQNTTAKQNSTLAAAPLVKAPVVKAPVVKTRSPDGGATVPPVRRERPVTPPSETPDNAERPSVETPAGKSLSPPPETAPAEEPSAQAPPAMPKPDVAEPATPPRPMPAPSAEKPADAPSAKSNPPQSEPGSGGMLGSLQDWLARANREYHGVIIKKLSTPPPGGQAGQEAAPMRDDQKARDDIDARRKSSAARKAAAEARRAERETRKAEEAAKARETQFAKEAEERRQEDLKRQEEKRQAQEEAARADDQRRRAEIARLEEERAAEQRRKADEAAAARNQIRTVTITVEPIPARVTEPIPLSPTAVPARRFAEIDANTRSLESIGSARRGVVVDRGDEVRRPPAMHLGWRRRSVPIARCRLAGRRITPPGTYVAQQGDTLWLISKRHYGDGRYYRIIRRANRQIADSDLIFPCQRVFVPGWR